ncbi:MAG: hypothetical protein ACOX4T_09980 [Acetivibrionales bacterium]
MLLGSAYLETALTAVVNEDNHYDPVCRAVRSCVDKNEEISGEISNKLADMEFSSGWFLSMIPESNIVSYLIMGE